MNCWKILEPIRTIPHLSICSASCQGLHIHTWQDCGNNNICNE